MIFRYSVILVFHQLFIKTLKYLTNLLTVIRISKNNNKSLTTFSDQFFCSDHKETIFRQF